jgi:hypothetical protein
VLHGGKFFGAGPGDGEEKDGVGFCVDVVTDRVAEGEESSVGEVVGLAVDGDADFAFEDLNGEGAVGVVFLHVGGVLHGDEDYAEVVLFEESFGVDAGGPGFFVLGFGDLFGEIELGDLVDHGAVLQGGCHGSLLLASAGKFTLSLAWMRCGGNSGDFGVDFFGPVLREVAYTCGSLAGLAGSDVFLRNSFREW